MLSSELSLISLLTPRKFQDVSRHLLQSENWTSSTVIISCNICDRFNFIFYFFVFDQVLLWIDPSHNIRQSASLIVHASSSEREYLPSLNCGGWHEGEHEQDACNRESPPWLPDQLGRYTSSEIKRIHAMVCMSCDGYMYIVFVFQIKTLRWALALCQRQARVAQAVSVSPI